jgi:DNA modification methylase
MLEYKLLQGNSLDVLKNMESESIQCVVTSPPYYGLRDYGIIGQIGLEKTPKNYIDNLVEIFKEIKRVLKDDGTLWLNLGDSYNGSGKGQWNGISNDPKNNKTRGMKLNSGIVPDGLKSKDLIGIPWMVAFALRDDGWYLRKDIIWAKPNPMPEAVKDRPTTSHEYIFLLSKNKKYYFDATAIAEPAIYAGDDRGARKDSRSGKTGKTRNSRDVWFITTKPYRGAHSATFPEEIPEKCIKAGSKIGDTILDPFSGAGTTGVVCKKLNRDYIGIELKPEYNNLAKERIDKFEISS